MAGPHKSKAIFKGRGFRAAVSVRDLVAMVKVRLMT